MRFAKRKWGWWFVLWNEKRFKVKLLCVRKNESLSLQKHYFRNELWLFLKGCGNMMCNQRFEAETELDWGFNNQLISRGEYYNIPVGKWHKYSANKFTIVLEIQYGDKCDETDIERNNE